MSGMELITIIMVFATPICLFFCIHGAVNVSRARITKEKFYEEIMVPFTHIWLGCLAIGGVCACFSLGIKNLQPVYLIATIPLIFFLWFHKTINSKPDPVKEGLRFLKATGRMTKRRKADFYAYLKVRSTDESRKFNGVSVHWDPPQDLDKAYVRFKLIRQYEKEYLDFAAAYEEVMKRHDPGYKPPHASIVVGNYIFPPSKFTKDERSAISTQMTMDFFSASESALHRGIIIKGIARLILSDVHHSNNIDEKIRELYLDSIKVGSTKRKSNAAHSLKLVYSIDDIAMADYEELENETIILEGWVSTSVLNVENDDWTENSFFVVEDKDSILSESEKVYFSDDTTDEDEAIIKSEFERNKKRGSVLAIQIYTIHQFAEFPGAGLHVRIKGQLAKYQSTDNIEAMRFETETIEIVE
jgi:hypothetical protein